MANPQGLSVATRPAPKPRANRNFKVVVDGEAFALRIGGKDTELLGIDRRAEARRLALGGRESSASRTGSGSLRTSARLGRLTLRGPV